MAETSKNWWIDIPGVTGEGKPGPCVGWVEVVDFNIFMSSQSTGLGKAPAKPVMQDCSVQLKGDAAAGLLFQNMTTCKTLGTIKVAGLKVVNKPTIFIEYTFKNCYTTSLSFQQSGDGGLAIGSFSFAYTEIIVEAFKQTDNGPVTSTGAITYDLEAQIAS
jgi:type VI protein secretion system component Hcp